MASHKICAVAVWAACFGHAWARRYALVARSDDPKLDTLVEARSDDSNLDEVVVDWQADLYKKVSALSDTPQKQKENFEKVRGKLLKVWDKTDKPSSLKKTKAALSSLSKAFTGGAKTFLQGIKANDPGSISKGVVDMAASVFSAIGTFSQSMGVVGSVLGFASAIMDFVLNIAGGPDSHGSTAITQVMRRVVAHELQENNVQELQMEYEGIHNEIKRIHNIFDELKPDDEAHAVSLLSESNVKQLTTDLTKFIGNLEFAIKKRIQDASAKNLKVLFSLYWQSNMQFSIIQQRAVGFITSAVTNTSDLSNMPTKYFVYVQNLQSQRDNAKVFLKWQGQTLDALSKTLLVGSPSNPRTFHLELDLSRSNGNFVTLRGKTARRTLQNLYVGKTARDSGYPYASMRPEPSPLELHWDDDSKWMQKSTVDVNEWISFVNPQTDAKNSDRIVFYFGKGFYAKYMDKNEAGYHRGGTNKKIDKVLFKFRRTGKSLNGTGPLKDGEIVDVRSKYNSWWMCGGSKYYAQPKVSDEDHSAYYIRQGKPWETNGMFCILHHWKIVVSGNNDLKELSEEWSKLYAALTANDPDDDSLVKL